MKYYYLYYQLANFFGTIGNEEYATEEEARIAAAGISCRNPLYRVEIWLFNEGESTLIARIDANSEK